MFVVGNHHCVWGRQLSLHVVITQSSLCEEFLYGGRHVCSLSTGMFAIRSERDYVIEEDFMKAVRKASDNKKLETKLDYKPV